MDVIIGFRLHTRKNQHEKKTATKTCSCVFWREESSLFTDRPILSREREEDISGRKKAGEKQKAKNRAEIRIYTEVTGTFRHLRNCE